LNKYIREYNYILIFSISHSFPLYTIYSQQDHQRLSINF